MSEKEKKILETMTKAIPNMSEFDKGYLLGMGEAMVSNKKQESKEQKEGEQMNNLTVFNNPDFGSIRTVTVNNEPYFVGKDVADILGYTNAPKAIKDHVDDEDKLVERIVMSGQKRDVILINESGLYSLILSSKMPNARKFKRWVTSEVLPSIRKHGMYAVDELLNNPDFMIKTFEALKEEREKNKGLSKEVVEQQRVISELQPKVTYLDKILDSKSLVLTTQIAKDYGMSARRFNRLLHELGVQYKVGDQWVLYAKYQACGYVHSRTIEFRHRDGTPDVKMQTEWTQKGRLFLYELLKENGYIPLIEKEDEQEDEQDNAS